MLPIRGLNEMDIFMVLKPRAEWTVASKDALTERIRQVLERFPGIAYGFTQPIEMHVSEMLTGVRGDVAVKLFGPDLDVLNQKANEIAETLRTVTGSEDVFASQNDGVQYLELSVDRLAVGRLDLDAQTLQRIMRGQIEGVSLGTVQEGPRRTPLLLRSGTGVRQSPEAFPDLPIILEDGSHVPLSALADVRRVEGVVAVGRERGQRFTVVRTNVTGRDLVGFVEEARSVVREQVTLPPGYYVEWGGQFENQQRASASSFRSPWG
jgi:cobalt-zinc-cadmium resistance protein CzcA